MPVRHDSNRVALTNLEVAFICDGVTVATTDRYRGDEQLPRIGETVLLPDHLAYQVADVVHDLRDTSTHHVRIELTPLP